MHACARVYTYTHVSNKMFIPANLMKRQADPPKSKQKSKNKAKMPMKNLAAIISY